MFTATRVATLVLLGALLAQAPLTAQAYQPHDRQYRTTPPGTTPTTTTASTPPLTTTTPSWSTGGTPASSLAASSNEPPAARSWSDVVKEVTETSPGDI